jgi:ribosomal protein S18 acetylase RimI-like enzyme
VSYAISTSIGGLVAKLDDVYVAPQLHGRGVGSQMLKALIPELQRKRVRRIDTSVHSGNDVAEKFYWKNGFATLGEERLTLLL